MIFKILVCRTNYESNHNRLKWALYATSWLFHVISRITSIVSMWIEQPSPDQTESMRLTFACSLRTSHILKMPPFHVVCILAYTMKGHLRYHQTNLQYTYEGLCMLIVCPRCFDAKLNWRNMESFINMVVGGAWIPERRRRNLKDTLGRAFRGYVTMSIVLGSSRPVSQRN